MDGKRLFCTAGLAERIERAEARFLAACCEAARVRLGAGFARPLGGGVATFAEAGSPFNKIAGLGFAGLPEGLDEVEAAFAELGAPVPVELCHLADPSVGAFLTARGYRLESYESVLGRRLGGPVEAADGVRPCRDDEVETWLAAVADASTVTDTEGLPSHERLSREIIVDALRDMAGVRRYTAERDGEFAGGACFRVTDGIAQFGGAATVPAHRRRGVQTALLRARLGAATAAGCDLAIVTTQPGSRSHRNAQRQGFDLLYVRAILVKGTSATRSSGADSRQAS